MSNAAVKVDDTKVVKSDTGLAFNGNQNKITELEAISKTVSDIKTSPYALKQMRTHRGPNQKGVAYCS